MTAGKILTFEALVEKVRDLRGRGKVVVQSHGIYDLIHPGVIAHLNSARAKGDVLVVTIIRDCDVHRGPGRPIFPDTLRAENVASLSQVDHVAIVSDEVPFQCIKHIKPDFYAKGVAFKDRDRHLHDRLFQEEKELTFGKVGILETEGFSFSSTEIINKFLEVYPPETQAYLEGFRSRYTFDQVMEYFKRFSQLRVLILGDAIIDEYHYCQDLSKSAKAQLIVNRYLSHEVFAGGSLAIANHMAGFCKEVHLVTVLGTDDSWEEFASNSLAERVRATFFRRDDAPTVRKKRYINLYRNQKLFEINYLGDSYISPPLEAEILECLKAQCPGYDMVLIADFGHGLITREMVAKVRAASKFLCVNTQTNGANAGFNLITRYSGPDFVCLDEPEVRLAAQEKTEDIDDVAKRVALKINAGAMITTLGKRGSVGIGKDGTVCHTPIFSTKVVDTVGAGDAFFSYAAPCHFIGMPLDLVSFIGNAVGALAVQIVGNKESVKKKDVLEFVHTLLK